MVVVLDEEGIIIRQIDTKDEAIQYGKGAGWCTSPADPKKMNHYDTTYSAGQGRLWISAHSHPKGRRPKYQFFQTHNQNYFELKERGNKTIDIYDLVEKVQVYKKFANMCLDIAKERPQPKDIWDIGQLEYRGTRRRDLEFRPGPIRYHPGNYDPASGPDQPSIRVNRPKNPPPLVNPQTATEAIENTMSEVVCISRPTVQDLGHTAENQRGNHNNLALAGLVVIETMERYDHGDIIAKASVMVNGDLISETNTFDARRYSSATEQREMEIYITNRLIKRLSDKVGVPDHILQGQPETPRYRHSGQGFYGPLV